MDVGELDAYFGVRLPAGLRETLQAAARQEDRTVSSFVRVLIRDDLARRGLLAQDTAQQPAGGQGAQHEAQ